MPGFPDIPRFFLSEYRVTMDCDMDCEMDGEMDGETKMVKIGEVTMVRCRW